jgi:hypothetical protein
MSKWVRGIYNAAANFNLSNALRATSMGRLGRNSKQLHTSADQRDQHVESVKSCESDQSGKLGSTCHRHRNSPCGTGDHCYANACKHANSTADNPIEREYNDYITATRSAKGQDTGSRLRSGNEFGDSQRSSNTTRTNVEYTTGIPTGTTI